MTMKVRELIELLQKMPSEMEVEYAYDGVTAGVETAAVEHIGAGRGLPERDVIILDCVSPQHLRHATVEGRRGADTA